MTELPFLTQLRIPAGELTGEIRLELIALPEAGIEFEAGDYEAAQSLLRLFAEGVNSQLFPGKGGLPAGFEIDRIAWHPDKGQCEMLAKVHNLPGYAWFHLLALLQKNHDALEPLSAVSLASANHVELPWQTLQQAVPQDFSGAVLPFLFEETGGIDKSKNLTVELEFEEELDEQAVASIREALMVWMQCVILGAFDSALDSADELDPLGDVSQLSSIRLQCFLPYFKADMSAFAALEHLLMHVHRRFALAEVSLL